MSVMIGIPVNRDFPPDTTAALIDTCVLLVLNDISMVCKMEVGCSLPNFARSLVVDEFLRSDKTHLACIDSDIVWKPEDFLRLLDLATKMEVVGAAYSTKEESPRFTVKTLPESSEKNEYGCHEIAGMGLGFTIIQRRVIEELAEKSPKVQLKDRLVAKMFRCDDVVEGLPRGEDISFFADIRKLGYSVWLDPTINLGHIGPKTYRSSDIRVS